MVTECGAVEIPGTKDLVVSEMGNVGAEIGRAAKDGRDFALGIGRSTN